MPKIKIERYWADDIKDLANHLSKAISKKDFNRAILCLKDLLEILENKERDGKSRVSICFIVDQLKIIDPFIDIMVDSLKNVLEDEKDNHVKEFAVWALGQIVQESRNLELIKDTMPIFIQFCTDTSEHVQR
ncbi:MAG: hypothetical protein GF364_18270, partial [Candidatus Lokiarchaeota archaeon]|nr:hypothetical protein [Candidatus Lokiarchaeota archaeon]